MRGAADNLTPATLELGGKSPVIVRDTYDPAEAAQRVMAVKLRSAGQICLAPDYALVPAGSEREFAEQCARLRVVCIRTVSALSTTRQS